MNNKFGPVFLEIGGPTLQIQSGGKTYYFEWHRYCGPMETTKSGDGLAGKWPRHVWDAVQKWHDQGKRMAEDGRTCIYD